MDFDLHARDGVVLVEGVDLAEAGREFDLELEIMGALLVSSFSGVEGWTGAVGSVVVVVFSGEGARLLDRLRMKKDS